MLRYKKKKTYIFLRHLPTQQDAQWRSQSGEGYKGTSHSLEMKFLFKNQAYFSKPANHFRVFVSSHHPYAVYGVSDVAD